LGVGVQTLQTIAAETAERARAAGYDARRAIERLHYGSFVSPARRYMYMETPKAACTSFKHLVMHIEGLSLDPALAPYQRETRPDMLVHHRRHIAMPTLLSVDAQSRAAILTRAPDWMVFALVRNPFSRLVSFFEHKVRMGEPGYGAMEARYGDVSGGLQQTFVHFVEEVVANPDLRNLDVHMMPQADIIMPRLIPYTHIFRLEAVKDAVAALAAHLGVPSLPLTEARAAGRNWRTYYNPRTAQMAADFYAGDFALFGYDAHDWKPRAETPANALSEEYWRGEVAARNAMIDLLYDRLGVPPANSFVEKKI
jgi:hypothetical protein